MTFAQVWFGHRHLLLQLSCPCRQAFEPIRIGKLIYFGAEKGLCGKMASQAPSSSSNPLARWLKPVNPAQQDKLVLPRPRQPGTGSQ
eukprot:1147792-Pelagomonas_calceolata.AAC.4